MSNWTQIEPGFCEGVIDGPPEIVNAITSLFMVFYGACGLFVTRNHNVMIRFISGMLTVCGIGSTGYHASMQYGWSMIDAIPMLISSWLGVYMAFNIMIYKKYIVDRPLQLYADIRIYEHLSGLLAFGCAAGLTTVIVLSFVKETQYLFSIWFLITELFIALALVLIRTVTHKDILSSPDRTTVRANNIMYTGVGLSVSAAIVWFTTESLCKANPWLRYLHAHGFWHASISAGMYSLMQFLIYVYLASKGRNPRWETGNNGYSIVFYFLVPAINADSKAEG